MLINGISFSVTEPILLIPPNRTPAVRSASAIPITQSIAVTSAKFGAKAVTAPLMEPLIELACDILPIPKEARMAKLQKRTASQDHF